MKMSQKALQAFAAAVLVLPSVVMAQNDYPTKIVRLLTPVAPGGGVDLIARTIAERLTKPLGQSFIVDNQGGGGGIIASQAVARAAPDGYTLLLGYVGTHGTNPAVRKLPYDAVNGFTHIAMIGGTPNVLVISPTLPVNTVKEFVSYLKANPTKVSYGSAGQGTLTHLVMEQFKEDTDTDMVHAAYRGIGPAIVDVMAGQTQAMVPGLAAALPHIKSGKLKPIAITGTQRHALLPDVPTFEELGYKGFTGVQWYGIMGPANMPKEIVTRLNTEINKQIGTPAVKEKLAHEAVGTMPMSPAQFTDYVKSDIAKWTALVKSRKLELQ
ncbi:MAG: hypothetical protein V7631_2470 [Massilia sp.]|jgi:tripartite-type tricarboxylate transporter receptor subunit TctC